MDPQCNSDMMEIARRWNFHTGQRTEECYSSCSNPEAGKPPLGGRRGCVRKGTRGEQEGRGRQRLRWWNARPPDVCSLQMCPRWLGLHIWGRIIAMAHIWRVLYRLWSFLTDVSNLIPTAKWAEQISLSQSAQSGSWSCHMSLLRYW